MRSGFGGFGEGDAVVRSSNVSLLDRIDVSRNAEILIILCFSNGFKTSTETG